jgi:hypothetical protein
MTEILCLRVSRGLAGKKFPFDRVYLTKYVDRNLMYTLFRYALILPVEGVLKDMLATAVPEVVIDRPFERDDAVSVKDSLDEKGWLNKLNEAPWVMAVPVLPKFVAKNMPRYLVAAGWFKHQYNPKKKKHEEGYTKKSPFPNRTFLLTPEKKIRPVCVACPRLILHQNGECILGEQQCYEHLALGLADHFKEGIEAPEATPNPKEPEVTALINGHLPTDAA